MTSVLLDTSVLIDPPEPGEWPGTATMSVLSLGELEVGVLLAPTVEERSRRIAALTRMRSELGALPIDEAVVAAYARLVAALREAGRNPRVIDTLIAATAVAHGFTLYTRDHDQARLPSIEVELLER